jgi:two-component system response regulator YesN
MYKVLIVDDELLVRVGLKTTIDWEANGFKVVAEASNGEQGFDQYKKHMPDVIITDIKMPKKDGLWLVEEIRKENHHAKILVLTCYDEFSYARRALKIGADDYILKSEIEDEELVAIMRSIKKKMDLDNKTRNMKDKVLTSRNDIKRSIFTDMIKSGFHIDANLSERCAGIEFPLINTRFAFASIAINDTLDELHMDSGQLKQRNHVVRNILLDLFAERTFDYVYSHQTKRYIFFLSSPMLNETELKKMFAAAMNSVKQYFDCSLNVVYTDVFDHLQDALGVYKTFIEKSQILFYKNEKSFYISDMHSISFGEPKVFHLEKEYNKQFIEAIGQESLERMKELIREVGRYFEDNNVNPMIVKIFISELIGNIFSSYGLFLENNVQIKNNEQYHQQIQISENVRGVMNLLLDFTSKVIGVIQQMRYTNSRLLINRALNYIDYHYDEKISLDDVAQNIHLSKHYLCNAFKKATGENMSLYINKLRIEKAKRLLLESDGKIKEIFEEVGYSNQQYFSKVFKRITGMTVMEYKESMSPKIKVKTKEPS